MGVISGYKNEISKDNVAIARRFIVGYDYGVINNGFNSIITSGIAGSNSAISMQSGEIFAYGYVGGILQPQKIEFTLPSGTRYDFIYAEIDMSRIPNTFYIKIKNNGRAATTEWRQDYLSSVRTGVFQLPLYRVKLASSGIVELTDLRDTKIKLNNAITVKTITKTVGANVVGVTPNTNDDSTKIATTAFVYSALTRIFHY